MSVYNMQLFVCCIYPGLWKKKLQTSRQVYLSIYLCICLFIQPYSLSSVKNVPANAGDLASIPGLGRSPGERNGNHSSIFAWKILWTEEPGELQSVGSQKSQTQLRDTTATFFRPIRDSLVVIVKNNTTNTLPTQAIFYLGLLW